MLQTYESSVSFAAKSRAIAIPVDLDSQVNNLFLKSHNIVQKTALNWRLSARNAARRDSVLAASRDYRNIIERLQVKSEAGRSGLGFDYHSVFSEATKQTSSATQKRFVGPGVPSHLVNQSSQKGAHGRQLVLSGSYKYCLKSA